MALVTALVVIGIACAIAAWFVIREAGRLASEPPPPVFDPEEAYEWVVEHFTANEWTGSWRFLIGGILLRHDSNRWQERRRFLPCVVAI